MRRHAAARSPLRRTTADHRQRQQPVHEVIRGAEEIAEQYPQEASQITAAAKESFLDGADWAYTAGILAIVLGAAVVFFRFPKKQREEKLLAEYHAEDTGKRVESV